MAVKIYTFPEAGEVIAIREVGSQGRGGEIGTDKQSTACGQIKAVMEKNGQDRLLPPLGGEAAGQTHETARANE